MVSVFRMSELQMLLSYAGQSKYGRKSDVYQRTMALLDRDCPLSIRMKIHELFKRRYPSQRSESSRATAPSSSLLAPSLAVPPLAAHCSTQSDFNSKLRVRGSDYDPNLVQKQTLSESFKQPSPHMPWQLPVHPDVRLKQLPFYDVQGELLKPSTLVPMMSSSRYQESAFTFHLTPQQTRMVTSSSRMINYEQTYGTQIQLRFCLLETSCEQDDNFPSGISVKVNGKMATLPNPIPTNKPGVEPKRPGRPVNITSLCKLVATSANQIMVSWNADPSRNFCLSVYLVEQLNTPILLDRLKKFGQRHPDHTRALIKEKMMQDPESEIATTSLRVSLICPLGKIKMSMPCRSSTCNHVQCCDATTFLQMNEKKPTWTCPVCDKSADFKNLVIDGLLLEILKQCPDATEIQFNQDGHWKAIREKEEKASTSRPKVETIADSPEKIEKKAKAPDIIDLTETDSEDEEKTDDDVIPDLSTAPSSPMSVLSTDGEEPCLGDEVTSSCSASALYGRNNSTSVIHSGKSSAASSHSTKIIDALSPLSVASVDSPASIASIRSPCSPSQGHSPGSRHHKNTNLSRSRSPPILQPEPLALLNSSPRRPSANSSSQSNGNSSLMPPPAHQHHRSNHHYLGPSVRSQPYPTPSFRHNWDSVNWNNISDQEYYDYMSSLLLSDTSSTFSSRQTLDNINGSGSTSSGIHSSSSGRSSSSNLLGFANLMEGSSLTSVPSNSSLPSSLLWPIPPPLGVPWSRSDANVPQSSSSSSSHLTPDSSLDFPFLEDML